LKDETPSNEKRFASRRNLTNSIRRESIPISGFLQRQTATLMRCHLLGIVVASSLIVCAGWLWSITNRRVSTIQLYGESIDLDDAATLVAEADLWRQRYQTQFEHSQQLDQRVAAINSWLAPSEDRATLAGHIEAMAEQVGLQIDSLHPAESSTASRVATLEWTCRASGSWPAVSRFLHDAAMASPGIVCHAIQLERMPAEELWERQEIEHQPALTQHCRVVLSLRIAYPGSETPASRLLKEDVNAI